MKEPIRILLADDNELFREGLAHLLESQPNMIVVGRCGEGGEVMRKAEESQPDLILMKIRLPGCLGADVIRNISASLPSAKVVVLTDSEEEEDLFTAMEAGARGYLVKNAAVEDLTKSVELLAKGRLVISDRLADSAREVLSASRDGHEDLLPTLADREGLSDREAEIVGLVAMGLTNRDIAQRLFITENTAKVHIKNILEKLGLRNKQQLAAYAVKAGLGSYSERRERPGSTPERFGFGQLPNSVDGLLE